MASFYVDLTANRSTLVDESALLVRLQTDVDPLAAAGPLSLTRYRIKKPTAWTPTQIAAAQVALDTSGELTALVRYQRTSREKDRLATVALIVRNRVGIPTWTGWSAQQKKDATLAEADVWVNIREFLEANA